MCSSIHLLNNSTARAEEELHAHSTTKMTNQLFDDSHNGPTFVAVVSSRDSREIFQKISFDILLGGGTGGNFKYFLKFYFI